MPNLNQRTTANVVFQFEIPADLVGKLIGKGGQTIRSISHQSRAHIVVNDYPYESCDHLKICTMDGQSLTICLLLFANDTLFHDQGTGWRLTRL